MNETTTNKWQQVTVFMVNSFIHSFWNKASNCLYEWVIELLTPPICSETLNHQGMKHHCICRDAKVLL